jgi:hypothetical protein
MKRRNGGLRGYRRYYKGAIWAAVVIPSEVEESLNIDLRYTRSD